MNFGKIVSESEKNAVFFVKSGKRFFIDFRKKWCYIICHEAKAL